MTMKRAFSLLAFAAVLCSLPVVAAASSPSRVPNDESTAISRTAGKVLHQYHMHKLSQGFQAANDKQGLVFRFDTDDVNVKMGTLSCELRLIGYGRGKGFQRLVRSTPYASLNRLEYVRGNLTEWYINGPLGLEQGFTLTSRPKGAGELSIAVKVSGDLTPKADGNGEAVLQDTNRGIALRYSGLSARDSTGKELLTSLKVQNQELLLQVDDSNAKYPVVVDPWVQSAELNSSTGVAGELFGTSVAISGSTVVIGAPQMQVGSNRWQGAAYVFVKPVNGWSNMTETAELTASDGAANDFSGSSVAIYGDTILVGAREKAPTGAVYLFRKPYAGWATMTETAKFTGPAVGGTGFGYSVAVGDGVIVVGSPDQNTSQGNYTGAVSVFVKPTNGWTSTSSPTAVLSANDEVSNASFGWSVTISGGTVAVGAPYQVFSGLSTGAAYVYLKPTNGWQTTSQYDAELRESDAVQYNRLGISVAVSGDTVVAGDSYARAAYVFVKPSTGWSSSTQTAKLTATTGGAYFGSAVAIGGSTIIVGDYQCCGQAPQGAAFFYSMPVDGWESTSRATSELTASDASNFNYFGYAVSVDGNSLVVGAPWRTVGSNSYQGSAYVFTR